MSKAIYVTIDRQTNTIVNTATTRDEARKQRLALNQAYGAGFRFNDGMPSTTVNLDSRGQVGRPPARFITGQLTVSEVDAFATQVY